MATLPLCRAVLRRNALPIGVGLTSGLVLLKRQQPMRFDAPPTTTRRQFSDGPDHRQRKDMLSPDVIKQLSGGSLAGFVTGLLVSVFSKTLVLLMGIGIVSIQVRDCLGQVHSIGTNITPGCRPLWHRPHRTPQVKEQAPVIPHPDRIAIQYHLQDRFWDNICSFRLHVILSFCGVVLVDDWVADSVKT
ncbi:hypothetical protein QBC47DRAFT_183362 [Echria macrotheca]|uniref:Uncharacterized protein n=1 Tax=Echria macrotheca TaxID=438768 RepID=A0AAJ0BDE5_9PEZI|nr:hypothetical protein QBC47DRAFT_183362 [Echria macrotheca]